MTRARRIPRDFGDTTPVEMSRLLAQRNSAPVERTDRWINRALAVAIGAALAWWLWEWAGQCAELFTCGLAMVRRHPQHAQSINEERLHSAIDAAYKSGDADGYHRGYRSGMRDSRVLHLGAGVVIGAALVVAALNLGWLAGGGGL